MNVNPELFRDSTKPAAGNYYLRKYIPKLLNTGDIDGIYVDSLYRWGNWYNHRKDHFEYEEYPLTYNPDNKKVAIHNSSGHVWFLVALKALLKKKYVFGNGVRANSFFEAARLDVLTCEFGFNETVDYSYLRVFAYQKPVCRTTYFYRYPMGEYDERDITEDVGGELEYYFKSTVLFGFFGTLRIPVKQEKDGTLGIRACDYKIANTSVVQRLIWKYVPYMRLLSNAGWEPVTWVRCKNKGIRIERYGRNKKQYLALLNTNKRAVSVSLDIVNREMFPKCRKVSDVLNRETFALARTDNKHRISLSMSPKMLRIVEFKPAK